MTLTGLVIILMFAVSGLSFIVISNGESRQKENKKIIELLKIIKYKIENSKEEE